MMKHILIVLVLASLTSFALAQEETPWIFGTPSEVVVGAQRLETLYTHAIGKWSNVDNVGIDSTEIECFKRFGFCHEANAHSYDGQAWGNLTTYDILRWHSKELI